MEKYADYIQRIEINTLWRGGRHIDWTLRPDVNILSGINGVGKSTIINHSANTLSMLEKGELRPDEVSRMGKVTLYPEDATKIRFDVIRSIDRPLIHNVLISIRCM